MLHERRSKRQRSQYGGSHRELVPLENDFETINFRTGSCAGPNGHPKESGRSYVASVWTVGNSWAPEESYDYSLDANDGWFDEVLEADVADVMEAAVAPKQKIKTRSQVSVSIFWYLSVIID